MRAACAWVWQDAPLARAAPDAAPIMVFVTVTIPDDKSDEFLEIMKLDVEGSRNEPGCLRFDLIRGAATDGGRTYHLYEAYASSEAMTAHKEQPHFKAWAAFKFAEGNEAVAQSQTVVKGEGPVEF